MSGKRFYRCFQPVPDVAVGTQGLPQQLYVPPGFASTAGVNDGDIVLLVKPSDVAVHGILARVVVDMGVESPTLNSILLSYASQGFIEEAITACGLPAAADALVIIASVLLKPGVSVVLQKRVAKDERDGGSLLPLPSQLTATLKNIIVMPDGRIDSMYAGFAPCNVARTIPLSGPLIGIMTKTTVTLTEETIFESPVHCPSTTETVDIKAGASFRSLYDSILFPYLAENHSSISVIPPKGILLHGPSGVGKTFMVHHLVDTIEKSGVIDVKALYFRGGELLSGVFGEAEASLRAAFGNLQSFISTLSPGGNRAKLGILFLDEIDAFCQRRKTGRDGRHGDQLTSRIVTQLLTLMDGISSPDSTRPTRLSSVVVIGASNKIDSLDGALRRPGRFEVEIRLDPPAHADRREILLSVLALRRLSTPPAVLEDISRRTVGYVAADLDALCQTASEHAARPLSGEARERLRVLSKEDFDVALLHVPASALRAFIKPGEVTRWNDIGGMHDAVERLREAIEYPLAMPHKYATMKLSIARGVLLHGPPGNSKTTLVKALATAVNASFYSLSGAELLSCFVGEAEKNMRTLFQRARNSVPSIIFLDELDAIVGSRGIGSAKGGGSGMLTTLLTELDGVQGADGVIVVGATNRPESLDPALLRPGRLEVDIHVPCPKAEDRLEIMHVCTRSLRLHTDVDLVPFVEGTQGWSGAEIANLCREAAMNSLREDIGAQVVRGRHFVSAFEHLRGHD